MPDENPFASPQTAADAGLAEAPESAEEQIRKQHLSHEASIQSMGVLFLIGGVIGSIVGVFMLVGAIGMAISEQGMGSTEKALALGFAAFVLSIGVLQFWVALGLRKLRANSRIPAIALSVLGLINIPIGTLISGYFLYLLLAKKGKYVFADEYQQIRLATPHIKYRTSWIVWVFLILLIAVIVFGIIGFAVSVK